MTDIKIEFSQLHLTHPGVSPGLALCYDEAVRVCLDWRHLPPQSVLLEDGDEMRVVVIEWASTDAATRDAWNNATDAIEAGAYGLALAGVSMMRGLVAVRRAETRTGADYYLGLPGDGADDLENCIRLEVSGTDRGSVSQIRQRLRQKVEQAARGRSNLPAMAVVVGFAALQMVCSDVG
jgi:hypothetical protein